jgi:hypothetical protein
VEGEEGEEGVGQLHRGAGGPAAAFGRAQSAAADLQHPPGYHSSSGGAGHQPDGTANGRYHRSFSGPAAGASVSLGGLLAASKLFAPILGALSGPAGAAHPATAALAAAAPAVGAAGSGPALPHSPSKRHLFGATWSGGSSSSTFSALNGHSNGGTGRPSLLDLKDELFATASFNGAATSAGPAAGGTPRSACVPLFC